ncbi:hypothetical protein [Leptospira sanjuanensis]
MRSKDKGFYRIGNWELGIVNPKELKFFHHSLQAIREWEGKVAVV